MKRIITAAALLAVSALSANAADLAARPYSKAPPMMMEPVYNWTGFYLGAHVGGVWARSTVTDLNGYAALAGAGTETRVRRESIFGGGQIGYNWQAGNWVFGIEADGGYMGLNRSVLLTGTASGTQIGLRDVAYGDITGRLGYAWGPTMIYGKGGYAVMEDPSRFSTVTGVFTGRSDRSAVSGYTVGGGVEYKFSPNWSAKVEYLHFDFGRDPSFSINGGTFNFRQDLRLDTVKVGVNYMWGGPVVARY